MKEMLQFALLIFVIALIIAGCNAVDEVVKKVDPAATKGPVEEKPLEPELVQEQPAPEIPIERLDPRTIPLIKKSEEGTSIKQIKFRPACVKGENGGEIYFEVTKLPTEFTVQLKEYGKEYSVLFRKKGLYSDFIYFSICDNCIGADFNLDANKSYIYRMVFNQSTSEKKLIEYSNEYWINTTPESDFMLNSCKQEKIILKSW